MAKSVNNTRKKKQKLNVSKTLLQLNELNLQLEKAISANYNLADHLDLLDESLKNRSISGLLNEADLNTNKFAQEIRKGIQDAGKLAQAETAVLKRMNTSFRKIKYTDEFKTAVIEPVDSYVKAAGTIVTQLASQT